MKRILSVLLTAILLLPAGSCQKAKEKEIPVASVNLNKVSLSLFVGETKTLTATILPENATDQELRWDSSAPAVASVENGVVRALSEGTTTITVLASRKMASCTVTVSQRIVKVTSVELDKTEVKLDEDDHVTLVATVFPEDATDKSVSWTSSDEAVATVAGGVVTAASEGSATITVRTNDGGFEATCAITVIPYAGIDCTGNLEDYGTDEFPYEPSPLDWPVEEHYDTTPWLATNSEVESFLENVTYTDTDFSVTHVTDYAGGPGEADIPPTYTISWTARPQAGILSLRVWEGNWSREYSLGVGATQKSISNLVPGREYRYEVKSISSGKPLAKGSFITKGRLHQVYFEPKVRNGRDLGGWTGLGGKKVAYRKLYRGGRLDGSYLGNTGRNEMLALGIKAEIDLREEGVAASESPLGSSIAFFAPLLEGGYDYMVKENPGKVAACFTFIVNCLRDNKPVYFHCAAGRDRTGTLASILLGVLGVSESDISKDYELTYFAPAYWSLLNGEYQHSRTSYGFRCIFNTLKETGESAFAQQVQKLLLDNGVSQQDIDDFRAIMLE